MQFIRGKYWEYEYDEVVTPNIYNFDLWKTSGHSDHYKQNMFHFEIEKQEFGLKPMNCPGKRYPISQCGWSCQGSEPCGTQQSFLARPNLISGLHLYCNCGRQTVFVSVIHCEFE